eukprot:TRINITY_DN1074_c0_g1_i2.p1 TRINITY_DN1074_c0_g1~~TRINITY_DN1074_c0_g1_i2.p1  ORF type:complete len:178 (-),score=74.07 TRINITY_DN1074_c0_g1_i2:98-631(-)
MSNNNNNSIINTPNGYCIRKAIESDCNCIAQLIRNLAEYEKEPQEAKLTGEDLLRDGFGETKLFECLIVEIEQTKEIIGFALYFNIYSTWKGRSLHLEDFYIEPEHRSKGLGKALFGKVVEQASILNCARLCWAVLDWNQSAIDFYERNFGQLLRDWVPCRMNREAINSFLTRIQIQ